MGEAVSDEGPRGLLLSSSDSVFTVQPLGVSCSGSGAWSRQQVASPVGTTRGREAEGGQDSPPLRSRMSGSQGWRWQNLGYQAPRPAREMWQRGRWRVTGKGTPRSCYSVACPFTSK